MDARGDQALELQVVPAGQSKARRDMQQDTPFLSMNPAIGGDGLDLDFHELRMRLVARPHSDRSGRARRQGGILPLSFVEEGAGAVRCRPSRPS